MIYGTKRGALRRLPLIIEKPARKEGEDDAAYAARTANVDLLNANVKVCVRNLGRTGALELQREAERLQKEGGARAAAEYVVLTAVAGVEGFVVGDPDKPDEAPLSLAPGIDPSDLVYELDGQHLLEAIATVGLTGQSPSMSQTGF